MESKKITRYNGAVFAATLQFFLSLYLRERDVMRVGMHCPSDEYDIRVEGRGSAGMVKDKGVGIMRGEGE